MTLFTTNLDRMITASSINAFGSSITWTGLPMLAMNRFDDPIFSAYLFLASSAANLFFPLFAGKISDHFSRKSIYFISSSMSIICLAVLGIFYEEMDKNDYLTISLISAFSGCFQSSSMGPWFAEVLKSSKGNTNQLIARKTTSMMTGKFIGMSVGPLMYGSIASVAFALDIFTSICELIILFSVVEIRPVKTYSSNQEKPVSDSLSSIYKSYTKLISLDSIQNILAFPVISTSLVLLNSFYNLDPLYVSVFWILGSANSLFINYLMKTGPILKIDEKIRICIFGSIFILGIIIMYLSSGPIIFLLAFSLIPLSNPVLSNYINGLLVDSVESNHRARVYAFGDSIGQFFTIIFLSLLYFGKEFIDPKNLLILLIPFAIFRILLGINITTSQHREQAHETTT